MTNVQTSPNGLQPIADRRASMGGFTLLELMLVITIAAILSGIGVPSFSRFIAEQRTIAAASDIQMALWRARSEAIRLRADVRLVPGDPEIGWESGWVAVDPTTSGHELVRRGPLVGVTLAGGPSQIVYRASGRLRGSAVSGIEIASKTNTAVDKRCVHIDLNGQPNMAKGGCSK